MDPSQTVGNNLATKVCDAIGNPFCLLQCVRRNVSSSKPLTHSALVFFLVHLDGNKLFTVFRSEIVGTTQLLFKHTSHSKQIKA